MAKKPDLSAIMQSCAPVETTEDQIAALLEEIEQLKSVQSEKKILEQQIDKLRDQLEKKGGMQQVPVDLIVPNPHQPRRTFSTADLNELAQSLKRHGQLEPVILIPQEDGTFFIFDGERRWRSARQIQWTDLAAVLIPPLEQKDLQTKALITTLCRQELNALDRAEAVLNNIEMEIGIAPDDAINLIKSCIFRLNRQKNTDKLVVNLGRTDYDFTELTLSESEIKILSVLLDLGINPSSFCSLDIKALNLPDDLKIAIRQQGLQIQHSLYLNRLSTKNLQSSEAIATKTRKKATTFVLEKNLSVRDTASYVNQLLSEKRGDQESNHPKLVSFLKSNKKIINTLNSDLPYDVMQLMEAEMKLTLENLQGKMRNFDPNS